MVVVSKRSVRAAAAVLVVLAIIGAYQGWKRSAIEGDVTSGTDGLLPVTNAVAAKQASALVEPPPPILTEAQIRTIARQEAQAALTRPSTPAASASSTPSSSASGSTPPRPAPDRPPPPPAPTPAPAAAPGPAGEPPPLY